MVKRRSNWPLAAMLMVAAAVQAGLTAFSSDAVDSTPLANDGVVCTACGPIPTGACALNLNSPPSVVN